MSPLLGVLGVLRLGATRALFVISMPGSYVSASFRGLCSGMLDVEGLARGPIAAECLSPMKQNDADARGLSESEDCSCGIFWLRVSFGVDSP
jgi:hypothetical protein